MGAKSNKQFVGVLVILALLFLPLLLKLIGAPSFPLAGSSGTVRVPEFSMDAWTKGNYQEACNDYATASFGARDWYVRCYNQIDFFLFNKANARYVVVGKNNCLYESGYLDAYRGKDYLGEEQIRAKVKRIKEVQIAMQKQGKLLLPIIAPGKASYYPEYIPEAYLKKLGPSNYEGYSNELAQFNVNYIDFRKWINNNKTKSKYPLYPLSGIHWSNYAALLCYDSIVKYASIQLGCNLPLLKINSVALSGELKYPDSDISDGLNLLRPLAHAPLAYADYSMVNADSAQLNVITVADSFWWYIFSQGLPQRSFRKHSFWYYNELMYPESEREESKVANSNYFKKLREADVVILLYSESNLHRYSDGALEACYETFCKPNSLKEHVQSMKETIYADKAWYNKVLEKAAEKGISADSMLTLDALYMVNQKH